MISIQCYYKSSKYKDKTEKIKAELKIIQVPQGVQEPLVGKQCFQSSSLALTSNDYIAGYGSF